MTRNRVVAALALVGLVGIGITLLAAAITQPCHNFFPTRMVEITVKTHEM